MVTGVLGLMLLVSSLVWAVYFDHLRNQAKYKDKSTFVLLTIGVFGFIILFLAGGIIETRWIHTVLLKNHT